MDINAQTEIKWEKPAVTWWGWSRILNASSKQGSSSDLTSSLGMGGASKFKKEEFKNKVGGGAGWGVGKRCLGVSDVSLNEGREQSLK